MGECIGELSLESPLQKSAGLCGLQAPFMPVTTSKGCRLAEDLPQILSESASDSSLLGENSRDKSSRRKHVHWSLSLREAGDFGVSDLLSAEWKGEELCWDSGVYKETTAGSACDEQGICLRFCFSFGGDPDPILRPPGGRGARFLPEQMLLSC